MDLGNDGLPLLGYSAFFEYLMRWSTLIAQRGFSWSGHPSVNLFCSPQQKAYLDKTNEGGRYAQTGLTDHVFSLAGMQVSVRPSTGHRGLTLVPSGPFVIPGPGGEDAFDVEKLTTLLKYESCRPALPQNGFVFKVKGSVHPVVGPEPLPQGGVIDIYEGSSVMGMPSYPLKLAANYHPELANRQFTFVRRTSRSSWTEAVFRLSEDPFRRSPEPDEESVALANLRASEAEW